MVGTAAGVGLGAIADFRYDLAVGDDTLTAAEVTALVELKSPLVRLRGQWVGSTPGGWRPRCGWPISRVS